MEGFISVLYNLAKKILLFDEQNKVVLPTGKIQVGIFDFDGILYFGSEVGCKYLN